MIPIRLSLRNFMCYRDTTEVLDLTNVHVACLSGENGAGKSALLEAITWVLWGKARDRVMDDELISKGASEMEVDFHFILNGQQYRVLRKRALRGKSATTILDVQVAVDPEGTEWKVLSGGTMKESQEQIHDLLKLDYRSFINSAFILQGRADEFTTRTPTERKRILADILGLQQYDRLEERAKEEVRARAGRLKELEGATAGIDRELAKRDSYIAHLEVVDRDLSERNSELLELRHMSGETQARVQALGYSKTRLDELETRIIRHTEERNKIQQRIDTLAVKKTEYESLIAQQDEIERGHSELESVERDYDRLNEVRNTLGDLKDDLRRWESQIEGEKARIEADQRQVEKQIAELESKLAGRSTAEQQLSLQLSELAKLEALQQQHEDTRCAKDALLVKMRVLTADRDTFLKEGQSIRQKLDMLLGTHGDGPGHAGCPLCGTDLTKEALEHVRVSWEKEREEKLEQYDTKKKEVEVTNREILDIERRLESEEKQLRPLDDQRNRAANARIKLERLDDDAAALAALRIELAGILKQLATESYAGEARKESEKVKAQISALQYNSDLFAKVQARRNVLKEGGFLSKFHSLGLALRDLPQILSSLEADERNLADLKKEQEQEAAEMAELLPQVQQLQEVTAKLDLLKADDKNLDSRIKELNNNRGDLRGKLARLDELEREKAEQTKAYEDITHEKGVYEELVTAFGKNGIQAMMIENILPEIEDEANNLLERMTDGRMTVRITTQRDAKSTKGVIETLDINISDEMGARAYEMYSGGEAFRVNFAIRIALSKLLARRAGTQLQTLVIDEGFGSQDGQGREKLIGAIRSIQSDFEKILVITHIEELKEEFPIRINIVKTNTGSRISMSEAA